MGKDALRVRATKNRSFTGRDWALEAKDAHAGEVEIFEDPSAKGGAFANMYEGTDTSYGKITNGKLHAVIDSGSVITFYHEDGRVLLKEHFRRLRDEESMPLNIMGREYSNGVGDNFRIVARFVARKGEKIFGMGQYQQHELDLKRLYAGAGTEKLTGQCSVLSFQYRLRLLMEQSGRRTGDVCKQWNGMGNGIRERN